MIAQIKLLQSACNNYSITPEEHFGAWFRAMERLSEAERRVWQGLAGRGRAAPENLWTGVLANLQLCHW